MRTKCDRVQLWHLWASVMSLCLCVCVWAEAKLPAVCRHALGGISHRCSLTWTHEQHKRRLNSSEYISALQPILFQIFSRGTEHLLKRMLGDFLQRETRVSNIRASTSGTLPWKIKSFVLYFMMASLFFKDFPLQRFQDVTPFFAG